MSSLLMEVVEDMVFVLLLLDCGLGSQIISSGIDGRMSVDTGAFNS